jgi:tRNA threonylcarbamoyladenosine biosynthesis protein TsaE
MQREFQLHEIQDVAKQLLAEFSDNRCFAFYAEMGSGKTTLIHALCDHLGVADNVSSPTFSIINEYEIADTHQKVYHMDWYRLKHTEDAFEAGVQDIISTSDAYCFIEWPEIAASILPKKHVHVTISLKNETTRLITANCNI